MRTGLDLFVLVDGLTLIACSRILAHAMKIPGDRSTFTRLLGLADDPVSTYYRFATAVLTGLVLAGAALADLFS